MKNRDITIKNQIDNFFNTLDIDYNISKLEIKDSSLLLNFSILTQDSIRKNEIMKKIFHLPFVNIIYNVKFLEGVKNQRSKFKIEIFLNEEYSNGDVLNKLSYCNFIVTQDKYLEWVDDKEKFIKNNPVIITKILQKIRGKSDRVSRKIRRDLSGVNKTKTKTKKNSSKTYEHLKKLNFDEYIEDMKSIKAEKGRISLRKRNWLYFIKNNMLECVATNKKVAYCSKDLNIKTNSIHYNFYTEDGELVTVDHKIPLSKGGSKNFENTQPMLLEPNNEKSNKNDIPMKKSKSLLDLSTMYGVLSISNIFEEKEVDRNNLGEGLSLVPVPEDELEEYSDDKRSEYHYLYKGDEKLSEAFFRRGGMCNGFKDGYCQLIEYIPNDRKSFGTQVIINVDGEVVLEAVGLNSPSHVKGIIGRLDGGYYNLETGEIITKGDTTISSEEYLFVENRYNFDYEIKKYGKEFEKGVCRINFKTGETTHYK